MVSTHKKKKKTFKKNKIKKIKKLSINNNVKGVIDVPISGRKLKGSLETLGEKDISKIKIFLENISKIKNEN